MMFKKFQCFLAIPLAIMFSLSVALANDAGIFLEKDVFLNTPILGPEDLPESITFNLYDSKDALVPIGSQTFNRGQYTVDFEFSKSDGVSGGDVARVKATFTEKLNLTDAQGESIKPKELWVALTVGDEEVDSKTKVSDEAMVQLLLNSDASIATYLTLVYEGDDNPITTIYKDLPMSTVTGGSSYSSLKDYFTVVASTGEATINADTRADYWLAGTGGIYYNGNVGVNNTAPNRDISVKYSSAYGGLENLPTISVANTNTTPGQHSFASFEFSGADGGVVGEFFADGGGFFLGGAQSVVFRSSTYDHMIFGTNSVNRMIIDRDGDVGIGTGTSLPSSLLHLKSKSTGTGGLIRMTTSLATGEDWYLWMDGTDDLVLRNDGDSADDITFQKDTGRIGLGSPNPGAAIHIKKAGWPHSFAFFDTTGDNQDAGIRFYENGNVKGHFYHDASDDSIQLAYEGHPQQLVIDSSGKIGVGLNPLYDFHVKKSASGHLVCLQNTNTSINADILRLQLDSAIDPGNGNNFISFVKGGTYVGNIDGNGSGGVRYNTSGADFAEWLPKLRREEVIEPGDIVGVVGGKITKQTENADYVQAISTAPGWVGNCPSDEEKGSYEQVAFMGQVPVRVRGSVRVGDYIVSSGLNDGTGVAVSPDQLRAEHHGKIIGRAWEASTMEGEKMINTAVSHNSLPHELYREKDLQIEKLASRVEILERALNELMKKVKGSPEPQT
jgi:hypothetical protein